MPSHEETSGIQAARIKPAARWRQGEIIERLD